MIKKISLMIAFVALLSACATGMKGSIFPMDIRDGVQVELRKQYYPDCRDIKPIEVVDIQPPEMKGKKLTVGDKWTEKWKISVCGTTKVHPVMMELREFGGALGGLFGVSKAE